MGLGDRLKHAWNAFNGRDPTIKMDYSGTSSSFRPDRVRLTRGNDRSIVNAIYNRIAIDVSTITIEHVRLDKNNRYSETIDDSLNKCLTLESNKDQTARSFIMDVVLSMFDEGVVAIAPIETDVNPETSSYQINSLRTGRITQWYPSDVKINVYDERDGKKKDLTMPKSIVSIVENPFYAVMNDPNSTSKRLIRKLNLLDAIDEQSGSGKLDLIIQLPYTIKSESRMNQAEARRQRIEEQLSGSKYGIAYVDATEHITQLNRPVENNLLKQIEYLTSMLYSQLGITTSVLDGTADEKTMANYYSRTVEPILSAIVDEMKRKFLTKTARSQKQSIVYYRDPFKLIPASEMADLADKFTRNEIISSNEMRQAIGMRPAKDPRADELRNKNLNQNEDIAPINLNGEEAEETVIEENGSNRIGPNTLLTELMEDRNA